MLTVYRSTPHPSTGITPCESMREATVRIKLDHIQPDVEISENDEIIDQRDAEYQRRMKYNREGRNTRQGRLLVCDYVLVRQEKWNKWSTPYKPVLYVVHGIQESRIVARLITGRENNLQGWQLLQTSECSYELCRRQRYRRRRK